MGYNPESIKLRPIISLSFDGIFLHNNSPTTIEMTRDIISVGCSDITAEAARKILAIYDKEFPPISLKKKIQ